MIVGALLLGTLDAVAPFFARFSPLCALELLAWNSAIWCWWRG
jgi:hypothetical protein